MHVINQEQFDDSDIAPENVCYVGIDRRILDSDQEFYVRSYDDEPKIAIIMEPVEALNSNKSKALVEFLRSEYGYQRFEFPCEKTGAFEEIDANSMQFINPQHT